MVVVVKWYVMVKLISLLKIKLEHSLVKKDKLLVIIQTLIIHSV